MNSEQMANHLEKAHNLCYDDKVCDLINEVLINLRLIKNEPNCHWHERQRGEIYEGEYDTSCDNILRFDIDYKYCPNCGGQIKRS